LVRYVLTVITALAALAAVLLTASLASHLAMLRDLGSYVVSILHA